MPSSDWSSVYRGATHTGVLGRWGGSSYMMGTFNGSVTFLEVMVSTEKLSELVKGRQSRVEEAPVPQPAGGADAIKQARARACASMRCARHAPAHTPECAQVWGEGALFPTRYFVSYDNATDAFAVGWRFGAAAAGAR